LKIWATARQECVPDHGRQEREWRNPRGHAPPRFVCRTFSDCTTAPRNGLKSGCYPLDEYYKAKPKYGQLKEIKKAVGA
jgi:hypothetical protein